MPTVTIWHATCRGTFRDLVLALEDEGIEPVTKDIDWCPCEAMKFWSGVVLTGNQTVRRAEEPVAEAAGGSAWLTLGDAPPRHDPCRRGKMEAAANSGNPEFARTLPTSCKPFGVV